jgi:hypothetical protein
VAEIGNVDENGPRAGHRRRAVEGPRITLSG